MLDGITLERAGIPAATICTDTFERTARATAELQGAADFPVLYTEHPISSASSELLSEKARRLTGSVIAVVTGGT